MGGKLAKSDKVFVRTEVDEIIDRFVSLIPASKLVIAGSYRRGKQTDIKDLDVVVIPNKKTFEYLRNMGFPILRDGDKAISLEINGLQIDFYFAEKSNFGAMLMRWTGPSGYNIGMSMKAKKMGWKLSQYGLFNENGDMVAGRTEHEIYQVFGKHYKAPAMRGK